MSEVTEVTVGFGRTVNTGNYSSMRADVSLRATVKNDENLEEVIRDLQDQCQYETEKLLDDLKE